MTWRATVTIEVGADKKLTNSQVLHAIMVSLQMDRFLLTIHSPTGDYSSNYVRVPIDGIKWEKET